MNDYHTLKNLEDIRNNTGKMKTQGWHLLITEEARPYIKNRNTNRMVNHSFPTVGVNIIGGKIVLNSTRSSKGKCMLNLKVNNQNKKMMVTKYCLHR